MRAAGDSARPAGRPGPAAGYLPVGAGGPQRGAGRAVDDDVAVVLHRQGGPGVAGGAAGPHRRARAGVEHEVPVALHDRLVRGRARGVRRPQRGAVLVQHQVPVALHVERVVAVARGERLPGGRARWLAVSVPQATGALSPQFDGRPCPTGPRRTRRSTPPARPPARFASAQMPPETASCGTAVPLAFTTW